MKLMYVAVDCIFSFLKKAAYHVDVRSGGMDLEHLLSSFPSAISIIVSLTELSVVL